MTRSTFVAVLFLFSFFCPAAKSAAQGGDESASRRKLVQAILSSGEDRQKLLVELASDPSKVVHETLLSWVSEEIYIYETPNGGPKLPVLLEKKQNADGKARAVRVDTGAVLVDDTGAELYFKRSTLKSADVDIRLRGAIRQTLDTLDLVNPDAVMRREAVQKLGKSQKKQYIPILQGALEKEANGEVKKAIQVAIANLNLHDADPAVQIGAIGQLSKLNAIGSLDDLRKIVKAPATKPEVAKAAESAIKSIEGYLSVIHFFQTIFFGMSSGSILLVVALGLAITFGLMGIINMAHGEMIAIGGYTSYVVEQVFTGGFSFSVNLPFSFFGHHSIGLSIPGFHAADGSALYESYFLFVIPLSFIFAALAGLLLERAVIQFLYRRPLESLLATWGVSLIMQQCFRMVFGANNVQINSPHWLKSNFTIYDMVFDYSRLFVIAFAVIIVIGTWFLLTRTPLGLLMRAVMQNRDMAACMGVRTQRVNMLTFAFGSGLAGLAGAFLSQIDNVGPGMGQAWIVDSFMTVVVGGVGNIVGTIYAALGIGTSEQVLQQIFGSPVVGTITVLISIILFLQWKPGGLFPTRSRSLEG